MAYEVQTETLYVIRDTTTRRFRSVDGTTTLSLADAEVWYSPEVALRERVNGLEEVMVVTLTYVLEDD